MRIIYRLWHLPTGFCYIGQTGQTFGRRLRAHMGLTEAVYTLDANLNNWLMASVLKLPSHILTIKEAEPYETAEIKKFIAEFGRDKLLNKSEQGFYINYENIKKAQARSEELGNPGWQKCIARSKKLGGKAMEKARAKLEEIGYKPDLTKAREKIAEMKTNGYKAVSKNRKQVSLWHDEKGLCFATDLHSFAREQDCSVAGVSIVLSGKRKQNKGWRLPIEGQDYCAWEGRLREAGVK